MSEHETTGGVSSEPTRRDFLYLTTGMAGAVGAVSVAWPFIDQMRPDASTLALASIEVDVSSLEPGMSLTAKWRGKPIFIRNRTPEEVKAADDVPMAELKDPIARNANLAADAQACGQTSIVQLEHDSLPGPKHPEDRPGQRAGSYIVLR